MAIPFSETFDYQLTVPDDWARASGRWALHVDESSRAADEPGAFGRTPHLRVKQMGPPDPSERKRMGHAIPNVNRAHLKLSSGLLHLGLARSMSFVVASELLSSARPGDRLYLRRDSGAGLSISVIRDEELIVAAGALCLVPLGNRVRVFLPTAAVQRAEAAFRELDPSFEFGLIPLAIEVDSITRILREGRTDLGPYAVFVVSLGFSLGPSEILSISHTEYCSSVAGSASAQLMFAYDLASVSW